MAGDRHPNLIPNVNLMSQWSVVYYLYIGNFYLLINNFLLTTLNILNNRCDMTLRLTAFVLTESKTEVVLLTSKENIEIVTYACKK